MTAITHRVAGASRPDDLLLRFALRADATLCGGVGLFVAMAADPLGRVTGVSATVGWLAGAALVAYGALLYTAARLAHIRRVGLAVLTGNALFVVVVVVVVAAVVTGVLALTGAGTALVLTFVTATLALSWLQYLGVRHLA